MNRTMTQTHRHPEDGPRPGRRRIWDRFFNGQAGSPSQNDVRVFRALAAALLLSAFALAGCSKLKLDAPAHSNPVDPDNPDFIQPGVEFTAGPNEGASVTTGSVAFRWKGLGAASQFQYRLDTLAWSNWAEDTSVTLGSLQEGSRRFQVQARDAGGYQGGVIATRNFVMNQYSNTVMIYPRAATIHVGDTLQLWCEMEDMATPVSAVEMRVYLQSGYFDTLTASADTGYHWRSNGGSPVGPLFSYYGSSYIDVSLGVAGGSPAGVSGTGRVFKIKVVALSAGTAYPQMTALTVRDTMNQAVTVNLPPNSVITIQAK